MAYYGRLIMIFAGVPLELLLGCMKEKLMLMLAMIIIWQPEMESIVEIQTKQTDCSFLASSCPFVFRCSKDQSLPISCPIRVAMIMTNLLQLVRIHPM
jgi:hypothetical protein